MIAIATEARTVDGFTPNAGTPCDETLEPSGNRPSFAAANGISAQIIVQPFSAPNPEMITRTPSACPTGAAEDGLTASENGAEDSASFCRGQDAEHGGQREHVDDGSRDGAEDRRPRDVAVGIAHLAAATAADSTPR